MPYRQGNYDFVIDSSFQPFSMQEMLSPLAIYKDAYEKSEEMYSDLTDKADKFKYLSETLPEGSKARQMYENYANELNSQALDLANNGLNMGNRRALTNLKRRYQGEIGRLVSADEAMQEEKKLRREMNSKDSSMLYANDNLTIDDFLDGNTPNLYNISGTELYTRGAAAGRAASSRIYNAGDEGSTLNGYYRKWVERNGYSKESMDAFRANASAIPELQQAADAILAERGVAGNLTGSNLERARQSVLNGIIDGAVYQESIKPIRDEGVMSAEQKAARDLNRENLNLNMAVHGMTKDSNGKYVSQDEWIYSHDENGRRNGYSEEYKKAIKEGMVPGKNVKMGQDGKSSNNQSKPQKQPLKKAIRINSTGDMSPVPTGQNAPTYGKKVSFAEAVSVSPETANYHPGYEQYYDYYVNGKTVTIIPVGSQATVDENEDTAVEMEDNNQI